jgi:hypothetical protein
MQKLIDPPMETLFQTLRRRHAIRNDVEIPELIFAFKTLQLGITALWAMEGPPFHKTEKVLRLQMKLFAEGLKSK